VRRLLAYGAVVALIAGALVLGSWWGKTATSPVVATPVAAKPALVRVQQGTLEEVRTSQVSAEWKAEVPLFNRAAGTIRSTSLSATAARRVASGDILYWVDGRAVIAVVGAEPAYRALDIDSTGSDVVQLQEFLLADGRNPGPIDGKWGTATAKAWKSWRADHDLSKDTSVVFGDVMFIPGLPRQLVAAEALVVGKPVLGTEVIANTLGTVPLLSIETTGDSSTRLPVGAPVTATIGASKVAAKISARRTKSETGEKVYLDLDEGCGPWCDQVTPGPPSTWTATIQLKPPVAGSLVPAGALRVGQGQDSAVMMADGTLRAVRVLAKVGAEVVVDGVKEGEQLQLPTTVEVTPTTAKS
jgi:peptidoglycan hydrolase-like protein with peptidoglycan-binding domain